MRVQVIDGAIKPMSSRPGLLGGPLNGLGDMDLEKAQENWTPKERKGFQRAMGISYSLSLAVIAACIAGGIISSNKNDTNNQSVNKPVLVKDTNQ